jgi:hypothetical protein
MSASNWGICPKCLAREKSKAIFRQKRLEDNYGKISQTEFVEEEEKLRLLEDILEKPTLREDYEIGVNSIGEFSVTYSASCQAPDCGFEYRYEHCGEAELNIED